GAKTHDIGHEPAARMKFYVLDPLFCFDPDDPSNRPVPGDGLAPGVVWASYPDRIRALFTRSFTAGLHEPTERVVDAEWCDALSELEDRYHECSACRGPCYLEGDRPAARCAYCASPSGEVVALCFDRRHVVVRDEARVVADRVRHDFDYETVVGTVEPHPSIAGLYGLRNDTEQSWTYRDVGGTMRVVAPGKRGSLVVGAELDLGGHWARVVSLGSDRRCCR
ncbi:MAG: hypothetical protein OEV40_18890, partial [Acidimicrobiia bacterium]|nr:hypothetical protein [Acidimicrobiia bacterium]